MKINSFLHFKEKKNLTRNLFLVLLLLALYGWYKNGLNYYFLGQMDFLSAMKPILFPICGVFLSLLSVLWRPKEKKDFGQRILLGMVIGLFLPPEFPLKLFLLCGAIFCFIEPFCSEKLPMVSWVLGFKIITLLLGILFKIPLQNEMEMKYTYVYGTIDTFFGRSIGDMGTTSCFLILILYLVCSYYYYYKKTLPIIIYGTFLGCYIGYIFLFSHPMILSQAMNSSLLFLSVFLAPQNETSPAFGKELVGYGILIGVLSFFFTFLIPLTDGVYYAFFLSQIFFLLFTGMKRFRQN